MATVKRPTAVTVIAILNLVFGIIGLLFTAVNAVSNLSAFDAQPVAAKPAAPADPTNLFAVAKEQNQYVVREVPSYKTYLIAGLAIGTVRTLLLIVSAICLLKMKPIARMLVFVYVAVAFIGTVGDGYYGFSQVIPATEKWEKERNEQLKAAGKAPPPSTAAIGGTIGLGAGLACGIVYAVVLLVVMMLPSVRDAFAGRGPAPTEQRDELDEDRPLRRLAENDAGGDGPPDPGRRDI